MISATMAAVKNSGDHITMTNSLKTDHKNEIIGYDLVSFFHRNTSALQTAITETIKTLLGSATNG